MVKGSNLLTKYVSAKQMEGRKPLSSEYNLMDRKNMMEWEVALLTISEEVTRKVGVKREAYRLKGIGKTKIVAS